MSSISQRSISRASSRKLLLVALLLLAWGAIGLTTAWGQETPPPVETIVATPVDFPILTRLIGEVVGQTKVSVFAETAGRIRRRPFKDGQWVEKDQVLFEIETLGVNAQLHQGEAAVSQAQARLDYAEAQVRRQTNLLAKGAAAKQDFELAQQERDLAHAALVAAQASLERAKSAANLTVVRAPISGYAGTAHKDLGDLVGPNQGEASLLTTIEDIREVRVNFYAPVTQVKRMENLARSFQVAEESRVFIPAFLEINGQKYPRPGRLRKGSARVDRQTGLMASYATFPNPDLELFSGQIVRIEILVMTLNNVIAMPIAAFLNQGQTLAVIGHGDAVDFRKVAADGPFNGYYVLKNGSGLAAGEKVVAHSPNQFRPGQKVQPQVVSSPLASYLKAKLPEAKIEPEGRTEP